MKRYVLVLLLISICTLSAKVITINEEQNVYLENLQKERDQFAKKRDLKAESRVWNSDRDKHIKRRDLIHKTRKDQPPIEYDY